MSEMKINANMVQGASFIETESRVEQLATALLAKTPHIHPMSFVHIEPALVSGLDPEVRTGLQRAQNEMRAEVVKIVHSDGKLGDAHTVKQL